MEVKSSSVKACAHHDAFHKSCHDCVVETVVHLAETIDDDDASETHLDGPPIRGLLEVFEGTAVTQFTDSHVANIVALPQTEEDFEKQIIRYTIELRPRKKES